MNVQGTLITKTRPLLTASYFSMHEVFSVLFQTEKQWDSYWNTVTSSFQRQSMMLCGPLI